MILSYKSILNTTLCILGLFVFILGCEEKAPAPQGEPPVTGNVTISDIKENYKTLDVQSPVLRATIIESKDVTNYTYLLLEDKTGKVWAAIPKTPAKVGEEIAIVNITVMKDFHSKTLEKTFDLILFAVPSEGCPFKGSEGEMISEMPSGMMPGKMPSASMPHGDMSAGDSSKKSKVAPQDIKVTKAAGKDAYTVEEIYSKKEELSQKTITVRAIVVKFMPQIMGKNWIHIQDGTGSAENGNNDISVSTLDTAEVGDEVIIKGTLGIDKDFGNDCAFGALIEEASINKVE